MRNLRLLEPITNTEITIRGNFIYGSQFVKTPYGYSSQDTLSGERVSLWGGAYKIECQLKVSDLSVAHKVALENFIVNTVKFGMFKFRLYPESDIDVGLGLGIPIIVGATFSAKSTAKVFKDKAPALFDVDLPYDFFWVV